MATTHDVIRTYRPELEMEEPLSHEEVVSFLVEKSGLEAEQIEQALGALAELAFWHLVRARPVPLPGVGSLKPAIRLDGTVFAAIDTDPELQARMNEPGEYRAGIDRHENIGVPLSRLVQMWNSSHPDDPVLDHDAYAEPA